MERFLSPGYKVKPPEEPVRPARGRPTRQVLEGALDLGERGLRRCGSRQNLVAEERVAQLERNIEDQLKFNKNQLKINQTSIKNQ